jgi:hypothetical protein
MTDAQIVERLREVRAFWAQRSGGPDSVGLVCRMLISEDEQLRADQGLAIDDPGWWRERGRREGTVAPESDQDPYARQEPLAKPVNRIDDPSPVQSTWPTASPGHGDDRPESSTDPLVHHEQRQSDPPGRPAGQTTVETSRLESLRQQIRRAVPPQRHRDATRPATPQLISPAADHAPPVDPLIDAIPSELDLRVDPITASGTVVRVRLSWRDPDTGRVVIRRAETQPPWQGDEIVTSEAVNRFGVEVSGEPRISGEWRTLEAEVPTGYQVYTPFIVRDRSARSGGSVALAVAPPISQLKARRTGQEILVTWEWQAHVGLAEVELRTADGRRTRRVSLDEFRDQNGLRLPAGDGPALIVVQTVEIMPDQTQARSNPVERAVAGRPVNLYWRPVRRAGRSNRCVVDLKVDRDCRVVALTFVAHSGPAMPMFVTPADSCTQMADLELVAGESKRVEFDVPKEVHSRKPYWIRCFAEPSDTISVVDPPLEYMKAT